jgi:hypothetical protein
MDSGLLGCGVASLGKWFLTFQRNVLPSSSRFQGPSTLNLEPITSDAELYPRRLESWITLLQKPQICLVTNGNEINLRSACTCRVTTDEC